MGVAIWLGVSTADCHLVEQWLKQVMVCAIDQSNSRPGRVLQAARLRPNLAKPRADDSRFLFCAIFTSIFTSADVTTAASGGAARSASIFERANTRGAVTPALLPSPPPPPPLDSHVRLLQPPPRVDPAACSPAVSTACFAASSQDLRTGSG